MPTNKNVLKDRHLYLGGSEISTILGISHFNTRFNLLLEKAELKETEQVDNEYTQFGEKFEPIIRNYINETMFPNDNFIEDTVIEEHEIISYRCNYDGLNTTHGAEIKTTSVIHETVEEYKYYLVQLLWGMMLAYRDKGILAVYHRTDFEEEFDPSKLQIFEVNIKDYKDLCEEIKNAANMFRLDLQKVKDNPFITEEDLQPKELINISNKLILMEDRLKEYESIIEEQKSLKSALKQAMMDYGVKCWTTPNGTKITLVPDGEDKEINKINEGKLKEEYPLIYAMVCEKKIQKGKAGYVRITVGDSNGN